MPPARARKSSTSSGRRPRARARYLGIEVAGEPVPAFSPSDWTETLRARLAEAGTPSVGFRIVRSGPRRAVVRLEHHDLGPARRAWNADRADIESGGVRTVRTWGTLVGAKRWLGDAGAPDGPGSARRSGGLRPR